MWKVNIHRLLVFEHLRRYTTREVAFPKVPHSVYSKEATCETIMTILHDAYELGFPLSLDRTARSPLHMQLCEQLRQAVLDGRLVSGTRLPSTRALAQTLRVSRTVTSSAYDELFAEGYLESRRGSGTYIGSDLPSLPCRLPYSIPSTSSSLAKTCTRHLTERAYCSTLHRVSTGNTFSLIVSYPHLAGSVESRHPSPAS